MSPLWYPSRPPIPIFAVVLSFSALIVPATATVLFSNVIGQYEVLLWLVALVPAFLLAYYRGWRGAATALAAGMAILSLTQVVLVSTGRTISNWPLLVFVVAVYCATALGIGWVSELLHRQRAAAELLALTDELTGLPNRRYADLYLEKEFAAAQRGRPLTVIFFDIDHFKDYNERHGHAAGDEALIAFGKLLESRTRKMDFSARYGGEEFLTILSSCGLEGGLAFVERLREAVQSLELTYGPITVSVGVATYHPGMISRSELLAAADLALYQAKQDGRDCVRLDPVAEQLQTF